ncbi:isochorismatase family protein [Colwellia sp. MEBiC06753]
MLTIDNTGVIVVDIQGKLARLVNESEALIANCTTLIKGAQVLDLPIIVVEQNPEKLGATVSELVSLLKASQTVTKFTFNACDERKFIDAIKSFPQQHWLVCGIEAHICLYQTAKGLAGMGHHVEVVSDCIASRTAENKQLAIRRLAQHGIEITSVEMCLYELVKDCRHPAFKQILSLVR